MKYGRATQIVNAASNLIAPQKIVPQLTTKEEFDEYDSTVRDAMRIKELVWYELSYELYEDNPPDTELTFNEQKKRLASSQQLFQQLVEAVQKGVVKGKKAK